MNDDFKTTTELSDIISKDLTARGTKFKGSLTNNAYLEAVRVINNHQLKCFLHTKEA